MIGSRWLGVLHTFEGLRVGGAGVNGMVCGVVGSYVNMVPSSSLSPGGLGFPLPQHIS